MDKALRKRIGERVKEALSRPEIRKKIRHHKEEEITIPPSNSSSLSYVLGALLGDGYLYIHKGAYEIRLKVKDKKFAESFREELIKIGIYPNLYFYPKTKSKRKFRHATGDWDVTAYCKPFYVWYKSLTTNDIYQIAKEFPAEFLRGFYEAEGSYFHYKSVNSRHNQYQLYMANTDLNLIKIIRQLLSLLDFKIWWSERTLPSEKTLYTISMKGGKQEIARFFDTINPCIKTERIVIKRICPVCGEGFIPKHSRQRYCSQKCRFR